MSKATKPEEREPIAPDPARVQGLVDAMSLAMGQYCQMNNGTMSDVLSACFTLTHQSVAAALYHTTPPLNVREQYRLRATLVGGVERLWNLVCGGGAGSKFETH